MSITRHAAVILAFAAAVAACSPPPPAPPPAPAQPARDPQQDAGEVIAAHRKLIEAYQQGDAETFVGMLEPSPRLLVFHPLLENRFDGIEEARSAAAAMFAKLGSSQWTDAHPSAMVEGDVAWLTSEVLVEPSGRKQPFVGRGTEIWVRGDAGWRLVHAHWSTNPENSAAR
jgi:ketosteroid isomerase-like protein